MDDTPIYNRMIRNFEDLKNLRSKLMADSDRTPLIWNSTLNTEGK